MLITLEEGQSLTSWEKRVLDWEYLGNSYTITGLNRITYEEVIR
jgi:hypothetical protein